MVAVTADGVAMSRRWLAGGGGGGRRVGPRNPGPRMRWNDGPVRNAEAVRRAGSCDREERS